MAKKKKQQTKTKKSSMDYRLLILALYFITMMILLIQNPLTVIVSIGFTGAVVFMYFNKLKWKQKNK